MATLEQAFGELLAASPAQPFVTYYDEASGERSELSVKSLANWVAKTHFLLIDELGLGAGDTAYVALPMHWISVPVLIGSLTAGLTLSDEPQNAVVAFVAPDTAASAAGIADVFAVAPQPAAVGFGDQPPEGTVDYVRAVRPQADKWTGVQFGAGESDLALAGVTRAQLVESARQRAAELDLPGSARILSTRTWQRAADWLDALFVPLAVGGSVVYVANASDEAVLDRRADQERVTARA